MSNNLHNNLYLDECLLCGMQGGKPSLVMPLGNCVTVDCLTGAEFDLDNSPASSLTLVADIRESDEYVLLNTFPEKNRISGRDIVRKINGNSLVFIDTNRVVIVTES